MGTSTRSEIGAAGHLRLLTLTLQDRAYRPANHPPAAAAVEAAVVLAAVVAAMTTTAPPELAVAAATPGAAISVMSIASQPMGRTAMPDRYL